jgi:hypothetical protein
LAAEQSRNSALGNLDKFWPGITGDPMTDLVHLYNHGLGGLGIAVLAALNAGVRKASAIKEPMKMKQVNATRAFLGDEPQWSVARVELYDVEGLWGGRRIYAEGSQRLVVQLVQPGRLERRYELSLGDGELKQLLDVFVENDFLTIKPFERPGIPDEARPRIALENAAGDKWVVAKWAGVRDRRFEAVYSALTQLERLTTDLAPVYTGPYTFGS